jgi:aconitate hydratase
MLVPPASDPSAVTIVRGPNIKPLPRRGPMPDVLSGEVLIKVGNDISTDHIMPAGAKVLPLRSNIPEMAKHVFEPVDPTFPARALEKGGGFVVGGSNYGQGSSREHAALAPMYLGVKAVVVKAFARIHLANLINFGILPLELAEPSDYDRVEMGDRLELDARDLSGRLVLKDLTKGASIPVRHTLSARDVAILRAGGKLPFTAAQAAASAAHSASSHAQERSER